MNTAPLKGLISSFTPQVDPKLFEIIDSMFGPPTSLGIREQIIEKAGGELKCWLCGRYIYLDEDDNHDARFSLDHVKKAASGGVLSLTNARPAHRLCNSVRHSRRSNKIKARFRIMNQHLDRKDKGRSALQLDLFKNAA